MDEALQHSEEIEGLVGNLSTCEYEMAMFSEVLEQIQKLVDNLNLRSYTNLSHWVADLDQRVSTLMAGWAGGGGAMRVILLVGQEGGSCGCCWF